MYFLGTAATTDSSEIGIIEPAAKQLNAFQRWWANLDWEAITGLLIQKTLTIIFIIILFGILARVANFLIDRGFRSYGKKVNNEIRMTTLRTLIYNIVQYTLGFFFIYALLSTIGIPVGSLLAGAGIAGLAIGLGAQGFMNDIITGFFIITEQQIDVGDYVRLIDLTIEGTVTAVGLRTLQLKSADGTVHFVPNRNITTISNTSRADMRVLVDVRIDPTEGIAGIQQAIERANQSIVEKYAEFIQTPPVVFGTVDLGNSNYAIRTTMYVTNGRQFKLQEELLTASIHELAKDGFTIPNSPILPK
ncbi:mechanosensitive ion channel family protein [Candidatus Enterococcus willemsii]|uniref:Mechanosensitive ion channel protein MscS n=1 Tax=Candidatus Enterococcus willemsii TaxID=1857215 RepID=A0ABQ6YYR6_9ENTE|nr:mechanosensitive ion channel family protein [Enterococcus sp. CU12B]KAF1302929.1 mechanosensitive ion channel protein MscS [Enterococcus sp. CU12B]